MGHIIFYKNLTQSKAFVTYGKFTFICSTDTWSFVKPYSILLPYSEEVISSKLKLLFISGSPNQVSYQVRNPVKFSWQEAEKPSEIIMAEICETL